MLYLEMLTKVRTEVQWVLLPR